MATKEKVIAKAKQYRGKISKPEGESAEAMTLLVNGDACMITYDEETVISPAVYNALICAKEMKSIKDPKDKKRSIPIEVPRFNLNFIEI